jgi:hypothetical protein
MRNLRKEEYVVFLILFVAISSNLVVAESYISQIEQGYNIGDEFNASITISPAKSTSNFFISTLVCDGQETEIYKSPFTIYGGSKKTVLISTSLNDFFVEGGRGQCYIRTNFGTEESRSRSFTITDQIDVSLDTEGIIFDPGQRVVMSGHAEKFQGPLKTGTAEIKIEGIGQTFFSTITDGKFSLNFTLPDNAPSGSHQLKAKVTEKSDFDIIINEGESLSVFKVRQVLKELDIVLDTPTVSPTGQISYTVLAYDQAKEIIETEAAMTISRADKSEYQKTVVRTNQAITIPIETDFQPGNWNIEAKVSNLKKVRSFHLEEYKKLEFNLENDTLTLKNIGNVQYSGPVEISIGGVSEVKDISKLPIGESKKFRLIAPDGNYDIEIADGTNREKIGTTALTGKAISVEDIGGALGSNLTILIGIIVILVLALLAILLYRKVLKGQVLTGVPRSLTSFMHKGKNVAASSPNKGVTKAVPAASALIDKGEKEESVIVSVKIKNPEILKGKNTAPLKALDSALWKAKEQGAKIYAEGDFRIIIFAPILTKEKDNSLKAIRSAQTIERMLSEHNKRSQQKISFGISANTGSLIVESKDGKFRFMSVDNTIAATKRISQHSNSEVIISETLHRKTVGKIKVDKMKNENLWIVNKVIDRSAHKDYIKNFQSNTKKEFPKGKATQEVGS